MKKTRDPKRTATVDLVTGFVVTTVGTAWRRSFGHIPNVKDN